jgi:hypothetical protein
MRVAKAKSHTHLQFATATNTSQKLQKSMALPTLSSLRKEKASVQHRIKLIAGFSLFTKVLAGFKFVFTY